MSAQSVLLSAALMVNKQYPDHPLGTRQYLYCSGIRLEEFELTETPSNSARSGSIDTTLMNTVAQHVPQPDHREEHEIDEQQGREHRGTVDEILKQAGRQAVDVRDQVEVETDAPDHDLQRQDSHRDPEKAPVLLDECHPEEPDR